MVVRLPLTLTTPPEMVRSSAGFTTQLPMLRLRAVLSKVMSLPAAATCRPAVTSDAVMPTVLPGRPLPEPMLMRTICGVLVTVGVAVKVAVLVGVFVTVAVKVAVGVSVAVAVGVGVWVAVGVSVAVAVAVGVCVGVSPA